MVISGYEIKRVNTNNSNNKYKKKTNDILIRLKCQTKRMQPILFFKIIMIITCRDGIKKIERKIQKKTK